MPHTFMSSLAAPRRSPLFLVVASAVVAASLGACDVFDHGKTDLAGLIGTQFVPMSIDEGGIDNGTLSSEAQLAPASFLTAVKEKFGRDFERVELSAVRMKVRSPANITAWSDLYSGQVSVAFIPASNPVAIVVAHGNPPAGVADFTFDVTASKTSFDAFPDIAAGNFRIQVSGTTPKGEAETFSQPVTIEVEFLVF